jgi:hypothetical protein
LVFSIHDPTEEVAIRKMIEASQRMTGKQNNNPAVNKHFKCKLGLFFRMHLEIQISGKHF